jgi:hypothetical protein
MESIVILLTGTIKVKDVPHLSLTDTFLREREYCKSIEKWIKLGYPIIFCENSNYDSKIINEVIDKCSPKQFEYMKFTSSASQLGKGHGEAEIIDYVFKNSRLVNDHSIICKVTGKNYLLNAASIFKKILQSAASKNLVIAILMKNLTMADSRFFFFKKEFYVKYWQKYIGEVNEANKIYIEHTLAKSIHIAIAEGEKWSLLPELPLFVGLIGTNGKNYKNKFSATLLNNFYYSIIKKWAGNH